MIAACYEYGKKLLAGQIHIADAANKVASETGMNENSAHRMMYDSIGGLFEGRKYSSAMSETATIWLCEAIRAEFGEEKFQTALTAVAKHLDYYENLPRGNAQQKIRDYVNQHKSK
jgi:5-methylcytosine-specific restriction protein A